MKESHTKNTNPVIWVVVGVFIGTIVIVLLGIIILWRIDPEYKNVGDGPTTTTTTGGGDEIENTAGEPVGGEDGKDLNYAPANSNRYEYEPNKDIYYDPANRESYEYEPNKDIYQEYTPQSTK